MTAYPSDFEIAVDNIMADDISDGECTWCEYEFSGDGTDVRLMQRCEFHEEHNRAGSYDVGK